MVCVYFLTITSGQHNSNVRSVGLKVFRSCLSTTMPFNINLPHLLSRKNEATSTSQPVTQPDECILLTKLPSGNVKYSSTRSFYWKLFLQRFEPWSGDFSSSNPWISCHHLLSFHFLQILAPMRNTRLITTTNGTVSDKMRRNSTMCPHKTEARNSCLQVGPHQHQNKLSLSERAHFPSQTSLSRRVKPGFNELSARPLMVDTRFWAPHSSMLLVFMVYQYFRHTNRSTLKRRPFYTARTSSSSTHAQIGWNPKPMECTERLRSIYGSVASFLDSGILQANSFWGQNTRQMSSIDSSTRKPRNPISWNTIRWFDFFHRIGRANTAYIRDIRLEGFFKPNSWVQTECRPRENNCVGFGRILSVQAKVLSCVCPHLRSLTLHMDPSFLETAEAAGQVGSSSEIGWR